MASSDSAATSEGAPTLLGCAPPPDFSADGPTDARGPAPLPAVDGDAADEGDDADAVVDGPSSYTYVRPDDAPPGGGDGGDDGGDGGEGEDEGGEGGGDDDDDEAGRFDEELSRERVEAIVAAQLRALEGQAARAEAERAAQEAAVTAAAARAAAARERHRAKRARAAGGAGGRAGTLSPRSATSAARSAWMEGNSRASAPIV